MPALTPEQIAELRTKCTPESLQFIGGAVPVSVHVLAVLLATYEAAAAHINNLISVTLNEDEDWTPSERALARAVRGES